MGRLPDKWPGTRPIPRVLVEATGAPLSAALRQRDLGPPAAGAKLSVYVDDAFVEGDWGYWTGGGHMQADTLEELHAMAERLGLKRAWFQSKPGKPWHDHYDLTRARREQAIQLGVIPVSWREAARRNQEVRRSGQ